MVPESGAVEVRPQVLLAEGGHAHEACLDGGRLQAVVTGNLAGGAGGRGAGGRRPVVWDRHAGQLGLQELLHHRAQHRVLVELRPRLVLGAALRTKVRRALDGPRLVQARPAEVVATRGGDRHLEGLQADGAHQLVGQGQLRHGALRGGPDGTHGNLAATAAGASEAARETKLSGGRAVPAAFQEVTWRAGRGLRGFLPGPRCGRPPARRGARGFTSPSGPLRGSHGHSDDEEPDASGGQPQIAGRSQRRVLREFLPSENSPRPEMTPPSREQSCLIRTGLKKNK